MTKTSIRRRLITRFGIIFFIAFLLVLLLSRFVLQAFYSRELLADFEEEMGIINSVFKEEVRENMTERSLAEMVESIRLSKRRLDLFQLDSNIEFISILNGNIRPLTGKEEFSDDIISEISGLIEDGRLKRVINLNRGNANAFKVYISPIELTLKNQNSSLYAVIYIPVRDETDLLQRFTRVLLVILSSVFLLTMVFVYMTANALSKPIRKLESYAISLGKSSSPKPVEVKTGDEIQALATAMNKMADELNQFQEEQGRFLQNASHELKTPLMSIRGYAEAIMDGVVDDEKEALETIVEESERLKRIVSHLSLLSKIETRAISLEMKDFPLNDCLMDSIKRVQSLADDRNIRLDLNLKLTDDLLFYGDRDSMIQVVINLVSNAVRYANSEVFIKTEVDMSQGENGWLVIHVTDDGNGIKEKMIPHVFERFYKGSKGQTGLGLAIVKAIAGLHEGYVLVENSQDLGAHFQICLPIRRKNLNINRHMP